MAPWRRQGWPPKGCPLTLATGVDTQQGERSLAVTEEEHRYGQARVRRRRPEAILTLTILAMAAFAEVLGDLGMRLGLGGRPWGYALGAVLLSGYGLLVNQPALAFGRALGLYIAVFFVVSQLVALIVRGERPSFALLIGGALIVAGGLVIHLARA